jgi:hypothetical protein
MITSILEPQQCRGALQFIAGGNAKYLLSMKSGATLASGFNNWI